MDLNLAKHCARYEMIYHAKPQGRLFKVLLSNYCENNCLYCENRKDNNNIKRYRLDVESVCKRFMELYNQHRVDGAFFSSGICKDPDFAQAQIVKAGEILREHYRFGEYLHLKVLPGASWHWIDPLSLYATRLSINLEAPKRLLGDISNKDFTLIFDTLGILTKRHPSVTTQFVFAVADETDRELLHLAEYLYKRLKVKRVYYSPFEPIKGTPLEKRSSPQPLRLRRIYQADALIRFYDFSVKDLVFGEDGNLYKDWDPKLLYACTNYHLYPISINKASYKDLLRIPGVGIEAAKRILHTKVEDIHQLIRFGVNIKKALPFIRLG